MNVIEVSNKRIDKQIKKVDKLLKTTKNHTIFLLGVKAGLRTAKLLIPLKEEE